MRLLRSSTVAVRLSRRARSVRATTEYSGSAISSMPVSFSSLAISIFNPSTVISSLPTMVASCRSDVSEWERCFIMVLWAVWYRAKKAVVSAIEVCLANVGPVLQDNPNRSPKPRRGASNLTRPGAPSATRPVGGDLDRARNQVLGNCVVPCANRPTPVSAVTHAADRDGIKRRGRHRPA
jgi:hypothetical protein